MNVLRNIAVVSGAGVLAGVIPAFAQVRNADAAGAPTAPVAVRGTDNALWTNSGDGWQPRGGQMLAAPAVASFNGRSLYVVTATDHSLWVRSDTTGWGPLSPGHTYCLDSPAIDVTGTTFTVACTGPDRSLWFSQSDVAAVAVPSVGVFSPLGGDLGAGPAVANVQGQVTFAVAGTDGRIYVRTATTGYVSTPWRCVGHPALAANGGQAYFACHGTDDAMWYSQNAGSGWTGAATAGGHVVDGVAVVPVAGGAQLVAQGTDGAVWASLLYDNAAATAFFPWGGRVDAGAVGGTASLVTVGFADGDPLANPACQVPANSVPAQGKIIIISIACQVMVGYQNGQAVLMSLTTTGRPARPTPRGRFSVVRKDHPWRMVSGDPAGSPFWYPPSWVNYVVWFTGEGHGIHDALWEPNSALGPGSQFNPTVASHGCVHINSDLSAAVYYWSDLGMPVTVF